MSPIVRLVIKPTDFLAGDPFLWHADFTIPVRMKPENHGLSQTYEKKSWKTRWCWKQEAGFGFKSEFKGIRMEYWYKVEPQVDRFRLVELTPLTLGCRNQLTYLGDQHCSIHGSRVPNLVLKPNLWVWFHMIPIHSSMAIVTHNLPRNCFILRSKTLICPVDLNAFLDSNTWPLDLPKYTIPKWLPQQVRLDSFWY